MTKETNYQLRLEKGQLRTWRAAAKKRGIPLADMIRTAMAAAVQQTVPR